MLNKFANWMNKQSAKLEAVTHKMEVRTEELRREKEQWNDPVFVENYIRTQCKEIVDKHRKEDRKNGILKHVRIYEAMLEKLVADSMPKDMK